ncbi:MAG: dihydrofolate reductase family protein [Thermoleophilia bacterium]|nr:dihydrofolate reductase family protein [Thermoleophilia bacterium]
MLPPLQVLYEAAGLPEFPLPEELGAVYGGSLGFTEPRLIANFVSSLDGAVAIPSIPASTKVIADRSETDRFVMGLLRACADALIMGASTFRGSAEARWTPASIYPRGESAYAELRRALGRSEAPELAIVSGSGALDPALPALRAGALVFTTNRGAERLEGMLPPASTPIPLGENVDVIAAIGILRARGHRLILSEGGPTLFGSLLDAGLVDELFLTLSPLVAGRAAGEERLSLVERMAFLPGRRVAAELLGVRRTGAHLFLRYAVV